MKLGTTSLSVTQPGRKGTKKVPPLVYDLTANTSVDEGATLVCNVSVNLPSGDGTLYWDIAHNTSNSSDFTAVSGTVSVTNQSGSFNINAVADNTTEGAETFDINLRTGSNSGPIVSTVVGVTINDTSITPVTKFYYWRAHDYGSHQHSMAMVVHDVTNGTSHSMLTYTTNSNSWVSKSVNIAQFSGHVIYFAHCMYFIYFIYPLYVLCFFKFILFDTQAACARLGSGARYGGKTSQKHEAANSVSFIWLL